MTDWYQTKDAKKVGFTARPVVGGVFAQMLYDQKGWKKWASRDQTHAAKWASMPKPPVVTEVVPTAATRPSEWFYTTVKPAEGWFRIDSDLKDWKTGKSGFGTSGTPGAVIGTTWSNSDLWVVRDIELSAEGIDQLHWMIHHDEDAEIYVNGNLCEEFPGYSVQYETRKMSKASKTSLKAGKNRISIHCHQTGGGQYLDIGLVTIKKQ